MTGEYIDAIGIAFVDISLLKFKSVPFSLIPGLKRMVSGVVTSAEEKLAKRASKTRGKGVSKAKRRKASGRAQDLPVHAEDHVDGCDVEFRDSEATPDAALPAARGGVEVRRRRA